MVFKTWGIIATLICFTSCMSANGKQKFYSDSLLILSRKYHNHITLKKDSTAAKDAEQKLWRKTSKKEIMGYLNEIEKGMALMPDSFIMINQPIRISNGTMQGSLSIDTKTIIITDKAKINYIRKHKILDSNIIIIEK